MTKQKMAENLKTLESEVEFQRDLIKTQTDLMKKQGDLIHQNLGLIRGIQKSIESLIGIVENHTEGLRDIVVMMNRPDVRKILDTINQSGVKRE
jgi:hypothetical protein